MSLISFFVVLQLQVVVIPSDGSIKEDSDQEFHPVCGEMEQEKSALSKAEVNNPCYIKSSPHSCHKWLDIVHRSIIMHTTLLIMLVTALTLIL